MQTRINDQGHIVVDRVTTSENGKLLVAVIISAITSVVLAIVGIVVSVYALSNAFTLFTSDSDQVRLYADNFNKGS